MHFISVIWSSALSGDIVSISLLVVFVLFILSLFSTVKKLGFLFLAVGIVLVCFFNYSTKDVIEKGKETLELAEQTFQNTVSPLLEEELGEATYEAADNGTYTIQTSSLRLTGSTTDKTLDIAYGTVHYSLPFDDLPVSIQQKIDQLKGQSK